MERVTERLTIADIKQELTRGNYKEKFHKLLCWEEKEHIDILGKRLDFIILEVGLMRHVHKGKIIIHLTKKLQQKL